MKAFAKAIFIFAVCAGSQAMASDAEFLQSIEGRWSGGGIALTKLGGSNVKVSCSMRSDANVSNFSMDGTCRALAVVSRSFNAKVRSSGTLYSGTYVGVSGKPSKLAGVRKGNTIRFDVTWANTVYGDRKATMTIQKVGEKGLRIRTIDRDPATGKTIVTTQLDLQRG
ncbi:hypothetical protein J2T09_004640 [Neorhizobium huautlense]|uniref:Mll0867 protein n=1 Tax=Neorhizobium huautlense TaxID=67774 RepID=A0ABT9PZE8_9HYPH|nr:hypothetical protein [Neorhizobium huautlense]MDP9839860.1 hypothetical protein [Neorhizobium huautlense]